jgi:myo-inositol 2-dehydrogenase/D-chiro-inositol 1-dehydrogenase
MHMTRVALLGAGRMGQIHLANLLALKDVELRYVFDPMRTGAYPTSVRSVQELNIILSDNDIDACVIAAPSTQHALLIKACARAGKHVFCEKPVSFDVDVLRAVKQITMDAGIRLQIGFNRRFDPSFNRVRDHVFANKLGALHLLRIVNRDPVRPRIDFVKNSGGLFFDFNVHDFDMLRFITGDEISEIYAAGNALIDSELIEYDDIDTAILTAKMRSGALAIIDSSRETGYGYDQQLEVFGEHGSLHVKNQGPTSVSVRNADGQLCDMIFKNFQERYCDSYRLELEAFFSTSASAPTIDDAIAAVTIAEAAQKSLEENRPVTMAE